MQVIKIISEYLEKNGYDGLYNPNGECACKKSELEPCECLSSNCIAGWIEPQEVADEHGYDFMIGPNNP